MGSGRAVDLPRTRRRRHPRARGRSPGPRAPARAGDRRPASAGKAYDTGWPGRCTMSAASVSMTVRPSTTASMRRGCGSTYTVPGGDGRREPPRRVGSQRPSGRRQGHIAVRSSTEPVGSAKARTIASTVKEARRFDVLVVHAALGVRHAVAARRSSGGGTASTGRRGRSRVDRQRDGVDGGGDGAVGLVLPDAGVRPEGGGDRQVAGELGEQAGVDGRIVGDLAEAHPGTQLGRTDRRVGIARVGVVDDAEVAARDRHVERRRLVRARARRARGSACRMRSGAVTSSSSVPNAQVRLALGGLRPQRGERPAIR